MLVNGKMTKRMDMENRHGVMEQFIKEIGLIINEMVKGFSSLMLILKGMKVNGKMTNLMDMVS